MSGSRRFVILGAGLAGASAAAAFREGGFDGQILLVILEDTVAAFEGAGCVERLRTDGGRVLIIRAAVGLDRGGDPKGMKAPGELAAVPDLACDRVRVDADRLADEDVPLAGLGGR